MFVRTIEDVRTAGNEHVVAQGSATSARYVTKPDGLGFSFSSVFIAAGQESRLWYKNHWEANFILSGRGEVEEVATGRTWPLEPGTLYVVGPEDRHLLRAT